MPVPNQQGTTVSTATTVTEIRSTKRRATLDDVGLVDVKMRLHITRGQLNAVRVTKCLSDV